MNLLVHQDEIWIWSVGVCGRRQMQRTQRKGKLEKTLEHYWELTVNATQLWRWILDSILITLMGGSILSTVQPILSSLLVLFDNRLEHKWPIDKIAMCSVYYTFSSVTDVFKLKEKLHLPHEMRKRRNWKLDKREGQPLKASWWWVCHCALYWLHQGRIIKNKTIQLCLLCL